MIVNCDDLDLFPGGATHDRILIFVLYRIVYFDFRD